MTQELQELTTDYKIQLRSSQTEYVSATNPKIYQFVAIRESSGRSVKPPLAKYLHSQKAAQRESHEALRNAPLHSKFARLIQLTPEKRQKNKHQQQQNVV